MRDTPQPAATGALDTPDEIAEMVRRFYADVTQDDLLGPMFNDVARVDWSEQATNCSDTPSSSARPHRPDEH